MAARIGFVEAIRGRGTGTISMNEETESVGGMASRGLIS